MMPSNSTGKLSENKLDEMTKLIKNVSAKINRLEMENKNHTRPMQEGDRTQNQIRRDFVPRFLPRERRNNDIQRERRDNEDQIIQPHFQNNLIGDDESYEVDEREVENLDEHEHDIDQFEDDFFSHFLTKSNYQYSNMVDYHEANNFEKETCMPYIYQ